MVGDPQPDTGVLRMEVPQPFRQVDIQRRLGCADTDCTMLKGRAGAQLLLGILYLHSSRGNAGIEHLPLRRQRHTPVGADKQHTVQLILQLVHRMRDVGLVAAQHAGRLGKIAVFCDKVENLVVFPIDIHRRSLIHTKIT